MKDAFSKALTHVIDDNSFLFNWLLLHIVGGSTNCISSIAKWQLRLSRCSLGYYPLRKQGIISFISDLTHKELCGLCHLFWVSPPLDRTPRDSHFPLYNSRRTLLKLMRLYLVRSNKGNKWCGPGTGKAEDLHLEYLTGKSQSHERMVATMWLLHPGYAALCPLGGEKLA